ncbi:MAG: hypothetical protein ACT4PT_11050, partial [Methanobacteriota archaeon]
GNINHFAAIKYAEDGTPAFHQQMLIRVTLNDVVVYETTPDSGHDYDGVNTFDVVFPVAGNYVVEVLDDEGVVVLAAFRGSVLPAPGVRPATIAFEGPSSVPAFGVATFAYEIRDADGAPLSHTDAWFEIRDAAGGVRFRTKTHAHEGPHEVEAILSPSPGDFVARVVAFQAQPGKDAAYLPAVAEIPVTVTSSIAPVSGLAPVAPLETVTQCARPVLCNRVVRGESSGAYEIFGTFDPWVYVGTQTQQHPFVLVIDPATRMPVPHVDFVARIEVYGVVASASGSHHEYDGILEFADRHSGPGDVRLVVDATKGDWKGHVELPWVILPAVAPVSLGPQIVETSGTDAVIAGAPADVEFFVHDLAGVPFAHGEIDLQVLEATTGVPILATKLHTHPDGKFPFTATFPREGDYVLRVSPFPLEARATTAFYADEIGGSLDIPVTVGAGPGIPSLDPGILPTSVEGGPEEDEVPAPVGFLFAALWVAAVLRRRAR